MSERNTGYTVTVGLSTGEIKNYKDKIQRQLNAMGKFRIKIIPVLDAKAYDVILKQIKALDSVKIDIPANTINQLKTVIDAANKLNGTFGNMSKLSGLNQQNSLIAKQGKVMTDNLSIALKLVDAYREAYRMREIYSSDKNSDAYILSDQLTSDLKSKIDKYYNLPTMTNGDRATIKEHRKLAEARAIVEAEIEVAKNTEKATNQTKSRAKEESEIVKTLKQQNAEINKFKKGASAINDKVMKSVKTSGLEETDSFKEYRLASQKLKDLFNVNTKSFTKEQLQAYNLKLIEAINNWRNLGDTIRKTSTEQIGASKDFDKFAKLSQDVTGYLNKYGTEIKVHTDLYRRFIALQSKIQNGSINFFDAKKEYAELRQESVKLGLETESLGKKLRNVFMARGRGLLANSGWLLVSNSLRDVWRNVVAIDTAMTELRKVTNATEEQYNQFLDNAQNRAQELGSTLEDVVSATADMARLGYNIEDASTLSDTALIYKNVGDDVENIEDASKSIISTMQGFNIEAENSMQIVDKFNEVANNYASSAGDIGEIVKRSAAAMKVSGSTIDETIALGVTANEVVQDADTIGTTLKTMSMRLRSSKSDLEAAGEDTDGMADSVSKLRGEIKKLTGVDIMLDEKTFKTPYDMMMEIGKVWDDLSDVSRANVGELLFGKRQTIDCLGVWKQAS